jgi:exodeoxyribonuclease-3
LRFRIATFNCNSVRARLPVVLQWLAAHAPDALALQETKCVDADFPVGDFERAGYHVVYRGEKSYNGVALASRARPGRVSFGLDDGQPPDEARLLTANVAGVWIVNTYVPQGQDADSPVFERKLDWLRRLGEHFSRRFSPRRRLAWVGDFNCAPAPMDVYDSPRIIGHVCHHPRLFEVVEAIRDWGFVDVFRKHRPNPGEYSFYDYRVPKALERGMGWRVDHIWATRPLTARSVDARVDLEPRRQPRPSDHTFVLADFDI